MMSGSKIMKIRLSEEQIAAICAELAQVASAAEPETSKEAQVSTRPHLSDTEFLLLCMSDQATADQLAREPRAHLAQCLECKAEWERLQDLGQIWQDPATRQRLITRRAVLRKRSGFALPGRRPYISLAALVAAPAAYASQAIPDPETVTFPVYEAGAPVTGLSATLRRRNHEYFALIMPRDIGAASRYGERTVVLTIADEEDEHPILTREIAVGVATLLGTHLPLAATSYVQADLVP
jgi:hypothetical protein